MGQPSNWPLLPESKRFVIPRKTARELAENPLSRQLYPLGIGYYQQASGHKMSRQKHDDHLLIYCIDGQGSLSIADKTMRINPGDLMILPQGLPHSYEARKQNPWSIYWMHFDGDLSRDFIAQILPDSQTPVISLGVQSRLVADFSALLESRQHSPNPMAFIHASNQLRQILTHIALLKPLVQQQRSDSLDLDRVHTLMQARLAEQLDLDTLAEAVNLSKYHFVKRYKALTGTTPINHFIHLRIEHACHLLDVTAKSIKEISYDVGYDDAYYFSRLFKKVMGLSPRDYRQMRLGGVSYR